MHGYLIEIDTIKTNKIINAVPDSIFYCDDNETLFYLQYSNYRNETDIIHHDVYLIELNYKNDTSKIFGIYKRSLASKEDSFRISHKKDKIVYCQDYSLDMGPLRIFCNWIDNYKLFLFDAPDCKLYIFDINLKRKVSIWKSMEYLIPERWSYDDEVVIFLDNFERIFYNVKKKKILSVANHGRCRYYISSLHLMICQKHLSYSDQRPVEELWCIDDHGENAKKIETDWLWGEGLILNFIRDFYYKE